MKRFNESWILTSKCQLLKIDPNYFYPTAQKDLEDEDDAKNMEALQAIRAEFCLGIRDGVRCPEKDNCLDYALKTNQRYGVWGGTTENERIRLRRKAKKKIA